MTPEFRTFILGFADGSSLIEHEFGYHGAIRDMSVSLEALNAGHATLAAEPPLSFDVEGFAALQQLVHILRAVFCHLPRYASSPERARVLHQWTAEIGRIAGR